MTTLESQSGASTSPVRGNIPNSESPASAPSSLTGVAAFIAQVKNNPIAGPKFVGHEEIKDELRLTFKDFPMSQMPPFAKEKFFGSLKKAAEEANISQVKSISFIDLASGKVMDQMALAK
jgi:hypothetical protein